MHSIYEPLAKLSVQWPSVSQSQGDNSINSGSLITPVCLCTHSITTDVFACVLLFMIKTFPATCEPYHSYHSLLVNPSILGSLG